MLTSENLAVETISSSEQDKNLESGLFRRKFDSLELVLSEMQGMGSGAKEAARSFTSEANPDMHEVVQTTDSAIDTAEESVKQKINAVVGVEQPMSRAEARASLRLAENDEWVNTEQQIGQVFDAKAEAAVKKDQAQADREKGQRVAERLSERPSVGGVKRRLKEGDMLGAIEMSDLIESDFGRSLAYRDVAYALVEKNDLDSAKEIASRIVDEKSRFGLEQYLAQLERRKNSESRTRNSERGIRNSEPDFATPFVETSGVKKATAGASQKLEVKEAVDTADVDEGWDTIGSALEAVPPDNLPVAPVILKMPTLVKEQEQTVESEVKVAQETGPTGTIRIVKAETGPTGTLRIEPKEAGRVETVKIAPEAPVTETLRPKKHEVYTEKTALENKREAIKALQYYEWGQEYAGSGMTQKEWSFLSDMGKKNFHALQFENAGYLLRLMSLRQGLKTVEEAIYKDRISGQEPRGEWQKRKEDTLREIRDVESLQKANQNAVKELKRESASSAVKYNQAAAMPIAVEAYPNSSINVVPQIQTMPSNQYVKLKKHGMLAGGGIVAGGFAAAGWMANKSLGIVKNVTKAMVALPNYLFKSDLGSGLVQMLQDGQNKILNWTAGVDK